MPVKKKSPPKAPPSTPRVSRPSTPKASKPKPKAPKAPPKPKAPKAPPKAPPKPKALKALKAPKALKASKPKPSIVFAPQSRILPHLTKPSVSMEPLPTDRHGTKMGKKWLAQTLVAEEKAWRISEDYTEKKMYMDKQIKFLRDNKASREELKKAKDLAHTYKRMAYNTSYDAMDRREIVENAVAGVEDNLRADIFYIKLNAKMDSDTEKVRIQALKSEERRAKARAKKGLTTTQIVQPIKGDDQFSRLFHFKNAAPIECTICHKEEKNRLYTTLSCDHTFHKSCLADWTDGFSKNFTKESQRCPTCQKPIFKK